MHFINNSFSQIFSMIETLIKMHYVQFSFLWGSKISAFSWPKIKSNSYGWVQHSFKPKCYVNLLSVLNCFGRSLTFGVETFFFISLFFIHVIKKIVITWWRPDVFGRKFNPFPVMLLLCSTTNQFCNHHLPNYFELLIQIHIC